jgi:hypothetical protein
MLFEAERSLPAALAPELRSYMTRLEERTGNPRARA